MEPDFANVAGFEKKALTAPLRFHRPTCTPTLIKLRLHVRLRDVSSSASPNALSRVHSQSLPAMASRHGTLACEPGSRRESPWPDARTLQSCTSESPAMMRWMLKKKKCPLGIGRGAVAPKTTTTRQDA